MSIGLTPEVAAASYDFLRTTLPFRNWNLPEADEVEFKIDDKAWTCAWYRTDGVRRKKRHLIGVSRKCVGYSDTLIRYMAHEMVHLHMAHTGMDRKAGDHGKAFQLLAAQVCKHHGFDLKNF